MSQRRKWSKAEKLNILKEAEKIGVTETIRKYELSLTTYYNWKKKVELLGDEAFNQARQSIDPEIKRLKEENTRLKQLLAEKELAIWVKEDLLKKTLHRNQRSS